MEIEADGSSLPAVAPRRRVQLADAMILVVAMAMGLGMMLSLARVAQRTPYDWFAELVEQEPWYDLVADSAKISALTQLTMPLVAMVTLALLPIRLIGTRPRLHRLARQPGLIASCASGMAMAFIALPVLAGALAGRSSWDGLSRMLAEEKIILSATMYGGLAVLVSWMTLFFGGRWRTEANWIDRLGRAMGLYWIVAASAVWAALFLADISSTHSGFKFISPTPIAAVARKILQLATITMPLVAMVTLALLPIRLIGTRPRLHRLARQPGLIASCASGMAMALIGLQVIAMALAAVAFADEGVGWEEISAIPAWLLGEEMVTRVTKCGGFAVLVSWMTQMIGRQWCFERSWVERLGRFIGVCWILAAFAVASSDALIQTENEHYVRLHPVTPPPAALDAAPQ